MAHAHWLPPSRFSGLRLGAPPWLEQQRALLEVQQADGLLETGEIEAVATAAHERARLPKAFVDPRLLARALDFDLVSIASGERGYHDEQTLFYRPSVEPARQGYVVSHELAHGLLQRWHVTHVHVDVQLLGIALFGARADVLRLCRPLRGQARVKALRRAQAAAPEWAVRLRLAMLELFLPHAGVVLEELLLARRRQRRVVGVCLVAGHRDDGGQAFLAE